MEYLIKQAWYKTAMEYGIDIFMTMNAIYLEAVHFLGCEN